MKINIDKEFKNICEEIIKENKTEAEWGEIESCDMFQSEHYCGGYEALEQEFCFSYYDKNNKEYWFQLPLAEILKIARGEITEIANLVERKSKNTHPVG